MINRFLIQTSLSEEEIVKALASYFPIKRTLKIDDEILPNQIFIKQVQNESELELHKIIEMKNKTVSDLENAASKAYSSIQSFHQQQQKLFDEFVLLRQKYDDQKASLVNILWGPCRKYHPELQQIPEIQDPLNFVETDEQVGQFSVGHALGEGQFATVKVCFNESSTEYALKIINKDRITAFNSLKRVSTEIETLKKLKCPYIVSIYEVYQTQSKLYIVTEKGGVDLFEFFDEHPDGVPEIWAKQIVGNILKAIFYCHELGICHRDIKPENVLIQFDRNRGVCTDLKLCDFGLCSAFKPRTYLSDFCGSPGFFAPEMILHGSYYGDKADIWSIGCVLLELILGHERFTEIWMSAYDLEVLREKNGFAAEIKSAVARLPEALRPWPDVRDIGLQLLKFRSTDRPSTRNACLHPWVVETMSDILPQLQPSQPQPAPPSLGRLEPAPSFRKSLSIDVSPASTSLSIKSPNPKSRTESGDFYPSTPSDNQVDQEILKNLYASNKERKLSFTKQQSSSSALHLPPIEPSTPNVNNARKMLSSSSLSSSSTSPNPHPSPLSPLHLPKQELSPLGKLSSFSPNPRLHPPFPLSGGSFDESAEYDPSFQAQPQPPTLSNLSLLNPSWSTERKSVGSNISLNTPLSIDPFSSPFPPSVSGSSSSHHNLSPLSLAPLVSQSLPNAFHAL